MHNPVSSKQVIGLETEAFRALVNEVVTQIKKEETISDNPWISDEDVMSILKISSRSTLQKYRDKGMVRYTQPSKKVILYNRNSIMELLHENDKDTF